MTVRARSRARGWALQILYAWETRGGAGPPGDVLREFYRERRIAEQSRQYLEQLIAALDDHHAEIDAALTGALTNWRLERVSAIDRNILRIGAAELRFVPEVPPRVAIQEALVLAEKYGTAESPRFVNGVLDALMRQGGEESGPGRAR